jgi:hypothetical protein
MKQVQAPQQTSSPITWRSLSLFDIRYGIGAVITLAGVVVLILVPGDIGTYGFVSAIGVGLSLLLLKAGLWVLILGLLSRVSVDRDRDRERRRAPA